MNNPSFTGIQAKSFTAIDYHNWFPVFKGAYDFSALTEYRLEKINSGLSINYIRSQWGSGFNFTHYNQRATINYAYNLIINTETQLNFGIGLLVVDQYHYNDDFYYGIVDKIKNTFGDCNLGLSLTKNNFTGGLAINNLRGYAKDSTTHFNNSQQLNAFVSYELNLLANLKSKLMVNYGWQDKFQATNISILLTYKDNIWMGAGFITLDEIYGSLGIDFKSKYRVGYAFGRMNSKLNTYNSNRHEFVMALMLN